MLSNYCKYGKEMLKNLLSELIINLNKLETSKKESVDNYRAEKYSNCKEEFTRLV